MDRNKEQTIEDIQLTLKEEIIQASKDLGIVLNKKSGQCILIDRNLANFIINSSNLEKDSDVIIEIGPGFGVLTDLLLQNSKKVYAIENDPKFITYLRKKFEKYDNLELINADALKYEFPPHTKLISNVPYYISGPLIEKIILSKQKSELVLLMLQHEFIQKLRSEPQAKNYGRLSVIGKTFFKIDYLKNVPPSVFYPQPNVESGIVKITLNQNIPDYLRDETKLYEYFEFVSGIFPYKNKTVSNSIALFLEKLIKFPKEFPYLSNKAFSKQGKKIGEIVTDIIGDTKQKRLWELTLKEIQDLFWMLFVL